MEKNYKINLLILSLTFIVLITNTYFSYENSLIFGGNDGKFYLLISKYAPNFGTNIEYIKGERFFLPYFLGLISKLTFIDLYFLYQLTSIFLVLLLIFFYNEILVLLKIKNYIYFISLFLVIFNPYLIRYYIAIPTIIVDLSFIISLELIAIGFLKKQKKFFFFGILLATLSRQNSIIILFVFYIIKFFFKKRSILEYKDLLLLSILFGIIYSLNTFYAINSSNNLNEVENLYLTTLFGILIIDYTLIDLFRYLYFPILGFGPLFLFIIILLLKKKLEFKKEEIVIFSFLVSLLLIGIAFVGGPTTTGKNLIRLANFSYIYIIISIIYCLKIDKIKVNTNKIFIIFGFIIFLWSFHPTFSNVKIWKFASELINY